MAKNSLDIWMVDPRDVSIPDRNLGRYVIGFSEEKTPFIWGSLLFNLLPVVGQIISLTVVGMHFWKRSHPKRILVYEKGFIRQFLNKEGEVVKEELYPFADCSTISFERTRRYSLILFFQIYNGTDVTMTVHGKDGKKRKPVKGMYRNEYEENGRYNYFGYSANAIENLWNQYKGL